MGRARALIVGATIVCATAGSLSMAQSGGQASAPAGAEKEGSGQPVKPSHRLVVIPAARSMDADFAQGCWVRFYDGTDFRGEELMLVGPLQLARMGTTSPWWRRWNSLVMGPNARISIYSEPGYKGRSEAIAAEQRSSDLAGKGLAWAGRIESANLTCTTS